jgi:hypothetical protein
MAMSLSTQCSRTFRGVLLVAVALAVLAGLPPTAHAQVVTLFVTGTGDPSPVPSCFSVIKGFAMLEPPGIPATAVDFVDVGATLTAQALGSLSCPSLRAAIRHANTNGNSGTDTIVLQGGSTYTLSIRGRGEDNALTGDLDIRSNVRITTNATTLGSVATVQGGAFWDDRIFDVRAGVVQIENLQIANGHVDFDIGGGIRNQGTLTLVNSTVTGNSANSGGGGIFNQGTLTLINSIVAGNSARTGSSGGGIANGGTLTLSSSTIRSNDASRDGGGIHNSLNATLTNSTVSENAAFLSGGGIANLGTLELTGTTVSSNRAEVPDDTSGGGIVNQGRLSVSKSTISSNVGAGIFNTAPAVDLTLTNSTVSSNNGAGTLTVLPAKHKH